MAIRSSQSDQESVRQCKLYSTVTLDANAYCIAIYVNLSFSHPWPVLMIVVYDNWMAVGSAILHMRMITWKIIM